jgi:hypothetical protein
MKDFRSKAVEGKKTRGSLLFGSREVAASVMGTSK